MKWNCRVEWFTAETQQQRCQNAIKKKVIVRALLQIKVMYCLINFVWGIYRSMNNIFN